MFYFIFFKGQDYLSQINNNNKKIQKLLAQALLVKVSR